MQYITRSGKTVQYKEWDIKRKFWSCPNIPAIERELKRLRKKLVSEGYGAIRQAA